jgi:hypothetical protein
MYSRFLARLAGRFYWKTVKRWPLFHALSCIFGIAVGVGCLLLLGAPEPNARKAVFLRVLGALMVLFYGWIIVAFSAKCVRGTWPEHCAARLAFFDAL